jgi:hypothetical protein
LWGGIAAKDLNDHAEILLCRRAGHPDAGAEDAAENGLVSFVRDVRQRLVEVRRADCDVVNAAALLGEEARVIALLVERLDQLPLHGAHQRCREPPGAVDRPSVLVQSFRLPCVELDHLPRPDPVVIEIPLHRRFEIAHHDSDLHRLGEGGLPHQPE